MTTKQYTTKSFNGYRIADKMTAMEWDDFFTFMKAHIKPRKTKYMTKPDALHITGEADYHMETEAWRYRGFINNVLKSVRLGEVDYCFYVFQVRDLLKYEPRITVRYLENADCFCVSYEE